MRTLAATSAVLANAAAAAAKHYWHTLFVVTIAAASGAGESVGGKRLRQRLVLKNAWSETD